MGAGFDADGKDEQHEGDVARTTGESEAKLAKQQSGKQHPDGVANLKRTNTQLANQQSDTQHHKNQQDLIHVKHIGYINGHKKQFW